MSSLHPTASLHLKSDENLLHDLKKLVQHEREILRDILHSLLEVEDRKLYLARGYPSLFEFATKELGYSGSAAQRRILAMRLIRGMPEVSEKIESGSISLCVAAQAQSFFKEENRIRKAKTGEKPFDLSEKREILSNLEGLSSRQCDRVLANLSSSPLTPPEKEKALPRNLTQIQFIADEALMDKLNRLKNLMAHRNFEGKYSDLFHQITDIALAQLDPRGSEHKKPSNRKWRNPSQLAENSNQTHSDLSQSLPTSTVDSEKEKEGLSKSANILRKESDSSPSNQRSRYIPAAIRRQVWSRDQGECTFIDPLTQRKCGSKHALQFDHHITPFAWGGESIAENLTLHCAGHNRFRAEEMGLRGFLRKTTGE